MAIYSITVSVCHLPATTSSPMYQSISVFSPVASSSTQPPSHYDQLLSVPSYLFTPNGQHEFSTCCIMHLSPHIPGILYAQAQLTPKSQIRSEPAPEAFSTLNLFLPFCSICLVHIIWLLPVNSHCFIYASALALERLWSFWKRLRIILLPSGIVLLGARPGYGHCRVFGIQ